MKIDFKFTTLLLVACAGVPLPVATELDAQRVRDRFPGVTAVELGQGRQLYQGRCGACHRPVAPSAVPAGEWPEHVGEMKVRAHLSDQQAALVEKYLITMSLAPPPPRR